MQTYHLESTESTPEIILDFDKGSLLIKGESYPENVTKCYADLFDVLKKHLEGLNGADFTTTFELIYFNSSSVKILMNLFEMLEEAAEAGNYITIRWHYQDGDETIEEFGEEFGEDIEHAKFEMQLI